MFLHVSPGCLTWRLGAEYKMEDWVGDSIEGDASDNDEDDTNINLEDHEEALVEISFHGPGEGVGGGNVPGDGENSDGTDSAMFETMGWAKIPGLFETIPEGSGEDKTLR
jgi:hypothetical protein